MTPSTSPAQAPTWPLGEAGPSSPPTIGVKTRGWQPSLRRERGGISPRAQGPRGPRPGRRLQASPRPSPSRSGSSLGCGRPGRTAEREKAAHRLQVGGQGLQPLSRPGPARGAAQVGQGLWLRPGSPRRTGRTPGQGGGAARRERGEWGSEGAEGPSGRWGPGRVESSPHTRGEAAPSRPGLRPRGGGRGARGSPS